VIPYDDPYGPVIDYVFDFLLCYDLSGRKKLLALDFISGNVNVITSNGLAKQIERIVDPETNVVYFLAYNSAGEESLIKVIKDVAAAQCSIKLVELSNLFKSETRSIVYYSGLYVPSSDYVFNYTGRKLQSSFDLISSSSLVLINSDNSPYVWSKLPERRVHIYSMYYYPVSEMHLDSETLINSSNFDVYCNGLHMLKNKDYKYDYSESKLSFEFELRGNQSVYISEYNSTFEKYVKEQSITINVEDSEAVLLSESKRPVYATLTIYYCGLYLFPGNDYEYNYNNALIVFKFKLKKGATLVIYSK